MFNSKVHASYSSVLSRVIAQMLITSSSLTDEQIGTIPCLTSDVVVVGILLVPLSSLSNVVVLGPRPKRVWSVMIFHTTHNLLIQFRPWPSSVEQNLLVPHIIVVRSKAVEILAVVLFEITCSTFDE